MEPILSTTLIAAGIGAAGGAVRIIISAIKRKQIGMGISRNAFAVFLFIYLIMGALSGLLLGGSGKAMSFLGGYAAVDLMDVYHKSFKKKKIKVK